MTRNLSTILGTFAFLLLALLCGRYLTTHWFFYTFASFQTQGAMIALCLSVLAILLHRNWVAGLFALLSAAIGIHGVVMLGDMSQPAPADRSAKPLFRLLSFNIMGDNSANGSRIADYILSTDADVVFIQESAPIGPDIDRLKVVYPYRLGCGAQTVTCDQSLWSKRPFLKAEARTASTIYRDRLMLASIDFDGRVINFANVHLTKPYFDAYHALELRAIGRLLKPYEGPLILAGDFNASILTPDVRKFMQANKLMTDGVEPFTWPVEAVSLGMAIDHVFIRDPLRLKTVTRVPDALGSNHFGLVADVLYEDPTATLAPAK